MSKTKRYIFRIRECGCVKPEHLEGKYAPSALIIEETEGRCGWVSYEDYDRLKAEVNRLTKAGNAMAEIFKNQMDNEPDSVGYLQEQLVNRWNAAKEGKPQP
jgi:hypothetical protein